MKSEEVKKYPRNKSEEFFWLLKAGLEPLFDNKSSHKRFALAFIINIVADSDLIGDSNSSSLTEDTHNL